MSTFANRSTDPDIRQSWVAPLSSSSSCRYVHTVLLIPTFGSCELHLSHHHADMCAQFYRFWHYVGFSLRRDVHICKLFYGSWHSAILNCINIIILMPICAHSSTDADIRQLWVCNSSMICTANSSMISRAYFPPQAHITSQADATPQPHAPWVFHPRTWLPKLTSLHKLTSRHKPTRLHNIMRPWFFHPRTWLHKLASLHNLTIEKRSNPTVFLWYLS